jgi:glyoxylase-like metal-dependent hydrolase (beta-lactamase superfamily II)
LGLATIKEAAADAKRVEQHRSVQRESDEKEGTNMDMKRSVLAVSRASLLIILLAPWAFPQAPGREITQIAGGEVFTDTTLVVAHENAKAAIIGERRPTAVPQVTFSDWMTIELGDTVLELSYVGRNHSDNSIVMRFAKERVLFAVDFIPVESVAFRDLPDAYIPDWIESLKQVELMDFDILAPGHGPLGRKEHVRMFREYMQDLHGAVLLHAREGKSLDEMKTLIKLPKYEKWFGYQQWFPLNLEGMYRHVQLHRFPNP